MGNGDAARDTYVDGASDGASDDMAVLVAVDTIELASLSSSRDAGACCMGVNVMVARIGVMRVSIVFHPLGDARLDITPAPAPS